MTKGTSWSCFPQIISVGGQLLLLLNSLSKIGAVMKGGLVDIPMHIDLKALAAEGLIAGVTTILYNSLSDFMDL